LSIAYDADAVTSDPETDLIYIGVSPKAHSLYARKAIEAK
jgi:predicted dehydrogenase